MSRSDMGASQQGLIFVMLFETGVAALNVSTFLVPPAQAVAVDHAVPSEAGTRDMGSQPMNPHSDLIFRATGATSCQDCHQVGKSGNLIPQPTDNDLVRTLREKAKGIHGPGRFADCLRCHAGGRKGVENY